MANRVTFHCNQDYMLIDDLFSSTGILRQIVDPELSLPKVPVLKEPAWYTLMVGYITGLVFRIELLFFVS